MGVFNISLDSTAIIDAGANQGVATDDGSNYWTTSADDVTPASHNFTLRHFNSSGVLQLQRDASGDMPSGATQINGLDYKDGVLYVGVNNFSTTPEKGWILEYDPVTLVLEATHATEARHCEGGAWRGDEFFSIYQDAATADRYNDSFVHQEAHALGYVNATGGYYQGAQWIGDYLLCNLHNSTLWPKTCDVFHWNGSSFTNAGRILQPTVTTAAAGQGISVSEPGEFMLWAERRGGGVSGTGPHHVIKTTINKTPNTSNTHFWDAINEYDLRLHLKCLEGSGTTLADASGNGHNGTIVGVRDLSICGDIMGFTKNADGRGVSMTNGEHIAVPHHADLSFAGDFTVCVTVFLRTMTGTKHFIGKGASGDTPGSNHNYQISYNFPSGGAFNFLIEENNGNNHFVNSTTLAEVGVPRTIYCVRDSTNDQMRIYIDGLLEATNTDVFTNETNTSDVILNGFHGGSDKTTDVNVFEPFIIADALTDAQALALHTASQTSPSSSLTESGSILGPKIGIRF